MTIQDSQFHEIYFPNRGEKRVNAVMQEHSDGGFGQMTCYDVAPGIQVTYNDLMVQDALSALLRNKTVMVIAHRMRTVANADKIVVLDSGRVSEAGTPDELMAKGGLYAHLVSLQQGG